MIATVQGILTSMYAWLAAAPVGTLALIGGGVLGVAGAVWQLTRPRYGGPDGTGCAFCTRPAIGSLCTHRGRRPGGLVRYCARHVGAAVARVKR